MPKVLVPSVGHVAFPDDMSPEDIAIAIEEDVLPSVRANATTAPVQMDEQAGGAPSTMYEEAPTSTTISGVTPPKPKPTSVMEGYAEPSRRTLIEERGAPVTKEIADALRYKLSPDAVGTRPLGKIKDERVKEKLLERKDWAGAAARAAQADIDQSGQQGELYTSLGGEQQGATPVGDVRESDLDWETRAQFRGKGAGMALKRGVSKGLDALEDTINGAYTFAADLMGDEERKEIGMRRTQFNADRALAMGDSPDAANRWIESAAQSITAQMPSIVMATTGAGAANALATMGAQVLFQEYGQGRKDGLDMGTAALRAAANAAFEIIGERLSVPGMVAGWRAILRGARSPEAILNILARAGVKEQFGEGLTYAGQTAVDMLPEIGLNQGATAQDILTGFVDTMMVTLLQSTVMVGGGMAVNKALTRLRNPRVVDAERRRTPEAGETADDAVSRMMDEAYQQAAGKPFNEAQSIIRQARIDAMNTSPTSGVAAVLDRHERASNLQQAANKSAAVDVGTGEKVEQGVPPTPTETTVATAGEAATAAPPPEAVVPPAETVPPEAAAVPPTAEPAAIPEPDEEQLLRQAEAAIVAPEAEPTVAPPAQEQVQTTEPVPVAQPASVQKTESFPQAGSPTAPSIPKAEGLVTPESDEERTVREHIEQTSNIRGPFTFRLAKPENMTPEEQRLTDMWQNVFGTRVGLFDGDIGIGWKNNGFFLNNPKLGRTFYVRRGSPAYGFLMGHEFSHVMRRHFPSQWKALYDTLFGEGGAFDESRRMRALEYHAQLFNPSMSPEEKQARIAYLRTAADDKLEEEILSDIIGHRMLDPKFWEELAAADPTLLQSVAQVAKDIFDKILKFFAKGAKVDTPDWVNDVAAARAAVVKAMKDVAKQVEAERAAAETGQPAPKKPKKKTKPLLETPPAPPETKAGAPKKPRKVSTPTEEPPEAQKPVKAAEPKPEPTEKDRRASLLKRIKALDGIVDKKDGLLLLGKLGNKKYDEVEDLLEEYEAEAGVETVDEQDPLLSRAIAVPLMEFATDVRDKSDPKLGDKVTNLMIAKHLDRNVINLVGRRLQYGSPAAIAHAIQQVAFEVGYQLEQPKSGYPWYTQSVADAMELTGKLIPALKSPDHQILFGLVTAILSPNVTPIENWKLSARAYQHFMRHGEFIGIDPMTGKLWAGGKTSMDKRAQLSILDSMFNDMGFEEALGWLTDTHTIGELREMKRKYARETGTYNHERVDMNILGRASDLALGMEMFGPKIGPFSANLSGILDRVTVDVWAARTARRLFGQLVRNGKISGDPTDVERRLATSLFTAAAEQVGITPAEVQSVMWFFEQQLYNALGSVYARSNDYLDAAKELRRSDLVTPIGAAGHRLVRPGGAAADAAIRGRAALETPSLSPAAVEAAPKVAQFKVAKTMDEAYNLAVKATKMYGWKYKQDMAGIFAMEPPQSIKELIGKMKQEVFVYGNSLSTVMKTAHVPFALSQHFEQAILFGQSETEKAKAKETGDESFEELYGETDDDAEQQAILDDEINGPDAENIKKLIAANDAKKAEEQKQQEVTASGLEYWSSIHDVDTTPPEPMPLIDIPFDDELAAPDPLAAEKEAADEAFPNAGQFVQTAKESSALKKVVESAGVDLDTWKPMADAFTHGVDFYGLGSYNNAVTDETDYYQSIESVVMMLMEKVHHYWTPKDGYPNDVAMLGQILEIVEDELVDELNETPLVTLMAEHLKAMVDKEWKESLKVLGKSEKAPLLQKPPSSEIAPSPLSQPPKPQPLTYAEKLARMREETKYHTTVAIATAEAHNFDPNKHGFTGMANAQEFLSWMMSQYKDAYIAFVAGRAYDPTFSKLQKMSFASHFYDMNLPNAVVQPFHLAMEAYRKELEWEQNWSKAEYTLTVGPAYAVSEDDVAKQHKQTSVLYKRVLDIVKGYGNFNPHDIGMLDHGSDINSFLDREAFLAQKEYDNTGTWKQSTKEHVSQWINLPPPSFSLSPDVTTAMREWLLAFRTLYVMSNQLMAGNVSEPSIPPPKLSKPQSEPLGAAAQITKSAQAMVQSAYDGVVSSAIALHTITDAFGNKVDAVAEVKTAMSTLGNDAAVEFGHTGKFKKQPIQAVGETYGWMPWELRYELRNWLHAYRQLLIATAKSKAFQQKLEDKGLAAKFPGFKPHPQNKDVWVSNDGKKFYPFKPSTDGKWFGSFEKANAYVKKSAQYAYDETAVANAAFAAAAKPKTHSWAQKTEQKPSVDLYQTIPGYIPPPQHKIWGQEYIDQFTKPIPAPAGHVGLEEFIYDIGKTYNNETMDIGRWYSASRYHQQKYVRNWQNAEKNKGRKLDQRIIDFANGIVPPLNKIYIGEMNDAFYEWFGDSVIRDIYGRPLPMVHGTGRLDIMVFKFKQAGLGFTSASHQVADYFVGTSLTYMRNEEPHLPRGPVKFNLFLRVERPWDYENPTHRRLVLEEMGLTPDMPKYQRLDGAFALGIWGEIEAAPVMKAMRALKLPDGRPMFDAATMHESINSPSKHVGVMDTNQLKEVTNKGTWSRTDDTIYLSPASVEDLQTFNAVAAVEGEAWAKSQTDGSANARSAYSYPSVAKAYSEAYTLWQQSNTGEPFNLFDWTDQNTVIYGAGGYNRYALNATGHVLPIASSFSSREKLAKALDLLGVEAQIPNDDSWRNKNGDLMLSPATVFRTNFVQEFERWNGSNPVFEPEDANNYVSGPATFVGYHGTTHVITDSIKPVNKFSNHDNFLGPGFYITTGVDDMNINYAGIGPDLEMRVMEQLESVQDDFRFDEFAREQMSYNYFSDPSVLDKQADDIKLLYGIDLRTHSWLSQSADIQQVLSDAYDNEIMLHAAREGVVGENEGTGMKLYVRLNSPFDIRAKAQPIKYRVNKNGDVTGELKKLMDALLFVATPGNTSYDVHGMTSVLTDLYESAVDGDIIVPQRLLGLLIKHITPGVDNDTGEFVGSGTLLQDVARAAGYDGIIMNAAEYFGDRSIGGPRPKGMKGLTRNTLHILPFYPSQTALNKKQSSYQVKSYWSRFEEGPSLSPAEPPQFSPAWDAASQRANAMYGAGVPAAEIMKTMGITKSTYDDLIAYAHYGQNNPANHFLLNEESGADYVSRRLADRFDRVKVVLDAVAAQGGTVDDTNNIYKALERLPGRTEYRVNQFVDNTLKPVLEQAREWGVEIVDVMRFMYAAHAKERNEAIAARNPNMPDGGSGMLTQDAANILAGYRASADFAHIAAIAQQFKSIIQETRNILHREGLISDEEKQNWEDYDDYVPLRGGEADIPVGERVYAHGASKLIDQRATLAKRALGRYTLADPQTIFGNIIQDYYAATVRSEQNKVGKVVLKFVTDNPDANLWEVDADRVVRSLVKGPNGETVVEHRRADRDPESTIVVRVRGKEFVVKFHDQLLARAMTNSGVERVGFILGMAQDFNRMLTVFWTQYNPVFSATNFVRDFTTGMVHTYADAGVKRTYKVGKYTLPAIKAVLQYMRGKRIGGHMLSYVQEYMENGGKTGYIDLIPLDKRVKELERMRQQMARGKLNPLRLGRAFLDLLSDFNNAVENGIRVASYRAAREANQSVADSISLAKNLTVNFNRSGELTPVLNAAFLFFNPNVQGTARIIRAIKQSPKAMAGVVSAMTITGFMFAMMSSLDEDDDGVAYWDKPDVENLKSKSLIFIIPGSKGRRVVMPMPYGYNVFFALGYAIHDMMRGKLGNWTVAGQLTDAILQAYMPVGSGNITEGGVVALMPTIAQPAIALWGNRNMFGAQIAPEAGERPDSERMFAATRGTPSQLLTTFLNDITGGDASIAGTVSISPESVDFLIRYVTGGIGTAALGLVNFFSQAATMGAVEADWQKLPFVRQFYGQHAPEKDGRLFWDRTKQLKQLVNAYNAAKENQDAAAIEKLDERYGLELIVKVGETMNSFQTKLKEIRDKEIAVRQSGDPIGVQQLELRELERQKGEVITEFNAAFTEANRGRVNAPLPPRLF